ncbi:MAG TPA: TetR/AcrR family transcriptional regulator [Microlunatus sp.]|nr:TetR/AcrR family transcriptional regulator [Microlunatus sp.]
MVNSGSRRQRTTDDLRDRALDLFERHGYEQTSAAQIAAATGVSEMTFFRHFSTKDQILLDDPYDDELVSAVAARPLNEPPLARTVNALRTAWAAIPEPAVEVVRRRTRIVANTPALRAAISRNNQQTEDAATAQLVADGCEPLEARAAVSAVLAALTSALLWWSVQKQADLSEVIEHALTVFDHGVRRVSA